MARGEGAAESGRPAGRRASRATWATRPQCWPTRSSVRFRLDKELARLYVYASMLSDQDTRVSAPQGMQQEMQQLYCRLRRRGVVHAAGDSANSGARRSSGFSPRSRGWRRSRVPLRDIIRRAAHTLSRCRGEDPGRRPAAGRLRAQHLRHPRERRFPVPDDHAERWPVGEGRSGRIRRAADIAGASRPGSGRCRRSSRARRVPPYVRHDDELEHPEGVVLRARPEVFLDARGLARRTEYSRLRVHASHRRHRAAPADVPSVSPAAQAHDGHQRRAALLRSLRATRGVRKAAVHAGGGAKISWRPR